MKGDQAERELLEAVLVSADNLFNTTGAALAYYRKRDREVPELFVRTSVCALNNRNRARQMLREMNGASA